NDVLFIDNHLIKAKDSLSGEYIIPSGIKTIADYAFTYCGSLTSVIIPDSVTSIGRYAFDGCSSLTSVTIPDSVTSIGDYTFYHCSSLASITIPDSVTSIGEGAFRGCSSLTSVTVSNGITSIGYSAFSNCSSLTSITIPDSVTSIDWFAFEGCSSLTSVTIPDSVKRIEWYAFGDCSSLTDVYYGGTEDQWNSIVIGSSNEDLLNATIHYNVHICKFGEWVVRTEPTCTVAGEKYRVCSVCGAEQTKIIPSTVHNFNGEWVVLQEPTCTIDGIKSKVCSVCGALAYNIISGEGLPKCTGSDYKNNMNKMFETVTMTGAIKLVIRFTSTSFLENNCDKLYIYEGNSVDSSKLVGTYTGSLSDVVVTVNSSSFTIQMTTDSSMTAYGFEIESVECYYGDSYQVIPATGHNLVLNSGRAATCTEYGVKDYYACTVCGEAFEDAAGITPIANLDAWKVIPAFGHTAVVDTKGNIIWNNTIVGQHAKVCATCGVKYDFENCSGIDFVNNGDTHSGLCDKCKIQIDDAPHDWHNGQCACGAICSHNKVPVAEISPTCTEAGVKAYVDCTICDFKFETEADESLITTDFDAWKVIPATGHSFGDWQMDSNGNMVRTCTTCGTVENYVIDASCFEYIISDGNVTITKYVGSDNVVVIPLVIEGCPVTQIGDSAFSGCSSLTSITIPNSVTSIGSFAFEDCSSLTSITIPDSVTS
ncbi:MAG: leucine-rich repeat protein, partial [Acutalibacteraceae bacterium]